MYNSTYLKRVIKIEVLIVNQIFSKTEFIDKLNFVHIMHFQ